MRPGAVDIDQVRNRLGLSERLTAIPSSATVRGVWFSMPANHVKRLGEAETVAWRHLLSPRMRVPFRMYPLTDFMEELTVAAALSHPEDPHEGVRAIWRSATPMYVSTPFGRSLVRLLRLNPIRYFGWLAAHRDHFCTYGRWRVEQHGDRYLTLEFQDEFIWIESAHRGGAEGVLLAFGLEGSVEPELDGRYAGRLHIRWK